MPQGHTPKGLIVGVKLHQINGEFVFPDYMDRNKINSGSQVLSALKNCKQIFAESDGGVKYIIPYHAVDTYNYGIDPYDDEKPADAFCEAKFARKVSGRVVSINRDLDKPELVAKGSIDLVLNYMIPYMFSQGVTVGYKGYEVTDLSYYDVNSWKFTDSNGDHIIEITEDDYGYTYPTVDGVAVETLSFTVNTEDRYVGILEPDTGDGVLMAHQGLYPLGARPQYTTTDYRYYYKECCPWSSSVQWHVSDGFKVVTDDVLYMLRA